jgi:hypothetical protein
MGYSPYSPAHELFFRDCQMDYMGEAKVKSITQMGKLLYAEKRLDG